MNTFVISLSLLVLILLSGYFFFSNQSEVLEQISEENTDSNVKSVIEDTKSTSAGKRSKVKPVKELKSKSSTKKEEKTKVFKKVNPKSAPAETPKAKRGRKKKS